MNFYFWKIRKVEHEWEVRRTGKNWHIHLGQGLFHQIYRCLTWRKPSESTVYLTQCEFCGSSFLWYEDGSATCCNPDCNNILLRRME